MVGVIGVVGVIGMVEARVIEVAGVVRSQDVERSGAGVMARG